MSNFEFVDRRGKDKPEPTPEVKIEGPVNEAWDDLQYMLSATQTPQGLIFLGRLVGLRTDGMTFVADYILPPLWEVGLAWESVVKERIDTFLGCSCRQTGPCSLHKMYIPQWQKQDVQRINLLLSQPKSKALLALESAERSARSNVIVPEVDPVPLRRG